VSRELLQRAFRDTYGLDLQDVFGNLDLAIGSYRHAVSDTIPMATRVAWAARKDEIRRSEPGMTRQKFVYVMKRSSYERNWGKQYDRPTLGDRILAFLVKLVPPIGPLKALRFKMPTPDVEKLFMESFNRSAAQYEKALEQAQKGSLRLEDRNYDVGVVTAPGTYRLDDDIHAYWLDKLASKNFNTVTAQIANELLSYYSDLSAPINTKKNTKEWSRTVAQLNSLKNARMSLAAQVAP
jgi:hypothetical protein